MKTASLRPYKQLCFTSRACAGGCKPTSQVAALARPPRTRREARKHDSVRTLNSPGALCTAEQREARMAAQRGTCAHGGEQGCTRHCGQQAHAAIIIQKTKAVQEFKWISAHLYAGCWCNLISMNHIHASVPQHACKTTHTPMLHLHHVGADNNRMRLALWIAGRETGATPSRRRY